jgi:hypothetical protein
MQTLGRLAALEATIGGLVNGQIAGAMRLARSGDGGARQRGDRAPSGP